MKKTTTIFKNYFCCLISIGEDYGPEAFHFSPLMGSGPECVWERLSIFKVTVWQHSAGLIDQWERLHCFYTVFQCSSHYFGISLAAAWMSIKVLITAYGLSVWLHISICCLSAIKAANSKLGFTREGVPVPHARHTHKNGIITLLLPWVMVCVRALVRMWVCLLLCWIMSDFATRYVSLIQIWKTEYTRTQLPGPPEEPVSPGQDRTERDGKVTGSRMGYAYRYCIYNNTDDGCSWQLWNSESEMRLHKKKWFLCFVFSKRNPSLSN